MKILITQDTDWVKRNPHQHHHLAERLKLKGHEIRVIDYEILWQTEGRKELFSRRKVFNISKIFKEVEITIIRPGILKIPLFDYISMLLTYNQEINRQMKEFKPDVLIGQSILTNYLTLRCAKKYDIPIIFHLLESQYTMIPFKFLQPIGKIFEKKLLKNTGVVITINEKLRDYAISMGANPDKTYIVKAGIDIKRYDPEIDGCKIRERYGIKKEDTVLFFMGWLYHFSGLKEVAIELSKIKDENPYIKILIVGDGDAFNDLQRIKEKYFLYDKLILTGKQPFDNIPTFIAASDICILPAYNNEVMRDIVPIKMYEYMAMGKLVIATELPGVFKEFGYNNGVIYVNKPADTLRIAIKMVENKIFLEEGMKARNFVKEFSWENIVDDFEEILVGIINEKK